MPQRAYAAPLLLLSAALLLAAACAGDADVPEVVTDLASDAGGDSADTAASADGNDTDDADPSPPSIAEQLGVTRYVGALDPVEVSRDEDETVYELDPAQGPMCMRGAPYRVSVRDTGSEDLVIFLQGGGACWSGFCLAVTGAPAGVPRVDILNRNLEANPVADWNVVYLPYCDGSFFAGDADHDDDINGNGPRYHRGLANLTAALEVAAQRFPSPRRILLAGSSGGGYGLLLGAPLTRHYFPDAELILMADSGIGLARDGDPSYIERPLEEFGLEAFIPDDCDTCVVSGHLTGVVAWYLERDDNVRVGMYSSWYDSVLAGTFLQVEPEVFARGLREQTDLVHDAHPDRFRRFIADGTQHTCLLADPSGIIGNDLRAVELPDGALQQLLSGGLVIRGLETTIIGELTMSAWLAALIDGDLDVWGDVVEEPSAVDE
jgi:hypothetical protein